MLKKKYIAGVSGGPDSMALLNMFKKKVIGVCHVNYCKRDSANRDEMIVKNFCQKNKILFFCLKAESDEVYKNINEKNFQTKARILRYDFYEECAQKLKCKNILLGHNLDDSLETAYDQLSRRVITLFYGIRPKSTYKSLSIYRPLIYLRKKTLQRYCENMGIEFGIDETNFSDIYTRNVTRKIISNWSQEKFLLFRNDIRKKNAHLKKINSKVQRTYMRWQRSEYNISFILNLDLDIRSFVLYKWLKENNIACRSRKKIYLIENFIDKPKQQKQLRLQNNIFLQIKDNKLTLC